MKVFDGSISFGVGNLKFYLLLLAISSLQLADSLSKNQVFKLLGLGSNS
jgi:hypothetical protein